METLAVAVRLGSFTKAASELGLTQSAVSNSIRRFERELGLTLFCRNGAQVEPTQAAIDIADAVAEADKLLRSRLNEVKDNVALDVVSITVAPTFASRWLAPRLTELRTRIAPATISILSRAELSETADIWIRNARNGRWPGLISKRLFGSRKAPVASPKLVGSASLTDEQVLSLPLLGVEARPTEWRDWARSAGLTFATSEPDFSFDVTSSTWDAAIAGSGVALGDLSMLRPELDEGKLVRLGSTTTDAYAYFVCRRRGDRRTNVKQVWDWFTSQSRR